MATAMRVARRGGPRSDHNAIIADEPTAREVELVKAEVAQSGEAAYAGIVWALFNTQQFRFVQ